MATVIWTNEDLTNGETIATGGVVDASNTSVGTGATWLVQGTVNQTNGLNLSDTSTGPWEAGFLKIASTGVYDITDSSNIVANASGATITNAGLLETTVGTGTSNINVAVTNTGTIDVDAGAMAFGASVNNSGTITDSGTGMSFVTLTNSGTINAGSAGLTITGDYTNTGAAAINVTGGTLALDSGGVIDSHFKIGATVTIDFGGGWFSFAGTTVTLGNLLNDSNSGITLSTGQTLTLTANDALSGADVTGAGTLVTTETITASSTYIGTGATWLVKGTVDQTNGLNLSDAPNGTWAAGFLNIAATGVYDITDSSAITSNNVSGAAITNAGLLKTTVGTGTSNINVAVTNTGTIDVDAGAMAFGASVNNSGTITDSGTGMSFVTLTNSGTINAGSAGLTITGDYTNTGAAAINVTGGTLALDSGGVIDSHFKIGATVTIDFGGGWFSFAGTTVTLGNLLNDSNSGITLSTGQTLTLTANDALSGADVTGAGTLVTTETITASSTYIGTGATWLVKGTVDQTNGLNLSDAPNGTWAAGFLNIAATGVYDITDSSAITSNNVSGAAITNAGLLKTTVGTGTSNINVAVTNTGTIDVDAGAMAFGASVNNSGTITDSGTGMSFVTLTNSGTINAGSAGLTITGDYTNTGAAAINVTGGTLALDSGGVIDSHFKIGATVTIDFGGGWFSFAGTTVTLGNLLNDSNSGITLSTGQTLTLTANDALSGADVTGAGTLVTTETITASSTYIGTGATWLVKGTVDQTNGLNLSDAPNGTWAAGFLNIAATGVYDITDSSAITSNNVSGAAITNAGLLKTTVGTGTSNINVAVTNTGTIDVDAGAMAFGASVNNSGTITDSGTGMSFVTLTNSGTINAGSAGLTITGDYTNTGAAAINVTGGTLALDSGGVIDSHFKIGATVTIDFGGGWFSFAGTTVTLGNLLNDSNSGITLSTGQTLTLTANDALSGADVTGAGTLVTTETITASSTYTGTGATWLVKGTVDQTNGLNLSDAPNGTWAAGFLNIAATGVYDITDSSAITSNNVSGAAITNAGLLKTTVGTGTSNINVAVTNTGTIDVDAGAMAFGASVNNSGTITDSGTGMSFVTLTNSGTINAGSAGLTITGDYTNTGAAAINVTGGTLALDSGGVIDSHFKIGATVTIDFGGGWFSFAGTTVTLGNLLNDSNSGITLSTGQTLTLTANDALSGADVTGAGTLVTTETITASSTYIGTGATWLVKGTVDQTNGLNLSDAPNGTWAAGFLNIAATGVYDITDSSAITSNNVSGAAITNAGLLKTTVGTGTSNINVAVTNTGTIDVDAGAMAFGAALTTSGKLEATAGDVALQAGAELDGILGAAKSAGVIQLNGGSFTTTKTATLFDEGASDDVLVNGTTWTVSGAVADDGQVALANSSSSLIIASGGTWTLADADAGFWDPNSFVSNNGTIAVSGATVTLGANLINNKLIDVKSGDLILDTPAWLSGTGTLRIETGATMELASDPGSNQTIRFNGSDALLQIDNPGSMSASIAGFGGGDTIKLIGVTANAAKVNSSNQLVVSENGTTVETYQLSSPSAGLSFVTVTSGSNTTIYVPEASVGVSGTAQVGQTLTSSVTLDPDETIASYQWQRNVSGTWTNIAGATSSSYTAQAADFGDSLRLVVSIHFTSGGVTTANSAATTAVIDAAPYVSTPTVSGTAQVGQTLTASANVGTTGDNLAFQWFESANGGTSWTKIAGATASTYQVQVSDFGDLIEVTATATNRNGKAATAKSSPTATVIDAPPAISGLTISGVAEQGQVLTAQFVAPPEDKLSYQWLSSSDGGTTWTPISGATSNTYTPQTGDLEDIVTVSVTATNLNGAELTSQATPTEQVVGAPSETFGNNELDLLSGASLSLSGPFTNNGAICLDPTDANGNPLGTGGSSLTVQGALNNNGLLSSAGEGPSFSGTNYDNWFPNNSAGFYYFGNLLATDTITVDSILNAPLTFSGGTILSGGTIVSGGDIVVGDKSLLNVTTGDAGFSSQPGVLTGLVQLDAGGTIEFAMGTISTIAASSGLVLWGQTSYIEDSGGLGSNSALAGLSTIAGVLDLEDGASVTISNATTLDSGDVWIDMWATGDVSDGGSALTAKAFTVASGGALNVGDDTLSASDAVTAVSLVNNGSVTLTGYNGAMAALNVSGTTTNNGQITITSDREELAGAVAGTGKFTLSNATLQLDSSVAAGETFVSTGLDTLVLGSAQTFAGALQGFATGDAIDATSFAKATTSYKFAEDVSNAFGLLTLTSGANIAHIKIDGVHTSASFQLAADSGTGTLVKFV